ncbi:MAG TPA: hypothetical protein VHY91_00095 [Pirellulales bacterium]|nr:hypothetical protein [Pirellulales bacterium]
MLRPRGAAPDSFRTAGASAVFRRSTQRALPAHFASAAGAGGGGTSFDGAGLAAAVPQVAPHEVPQVVQGVEQQELHARWQRLPQRW